MSQKFSWDENLIKHSPQEVVASLGSKDTGINDNEVKLRHKKYGLNIIHEKKINILSMVIRQITGNPLIMVLLGATIISFLLGEKISSFYIFWMIMVSTILGFWNEYSAENTVDNLLKKISHRSLVIRNGEKMEILSSFLTIGDIVMLSPASIVPADLRLIETDNLEINQRALTGEAMPVEKNSSPILNLPDDLNELKNIAFLGTNVESGSGKGIVIAIAKDTEYGKIAKSTTFIKPVTEFQKGLADFGRMIIKVILVLTVGIFLINFFLGKELLEAFLFSLAIAVGLTPELLPVIVTISLSHGAGLLSKKHVIVKRLLSIENLGNMDILCTDKTGTLTEGQIRLVDYQDLSGDKKEDILETAFICNSTVGHHRLIGNAIDVSIYEYYKKYISQKEKPWLKKFEEPFDYNRKMMFTVADIKGKNILIAKGAPEEIAKMCRLNKEKILFKFKAFSSDGFRTIAIAQKTVPYKKSYSWDDLKEMEFLGYINFLDLPKKSAKAALERLTRLNVKLKVITGDNDLVTKRICTEVGLISKKIINGAKLNDISDEEFADIAENYDIFARISPRQKMQIVQALQKNGHTVGYLGDGINDIPTLHNADVGISVDTAVDVAKDAANVVLLRKSLNVIADGIMEGRRTFNNTIKYILMGTSSNFGNMFSAAGASIFLKFLPMTPVQILLNNALYDVSQMSIPSDNVDPESLIKPRHWNMNYIKKYMLFFGPISSIYDFATFFIMLEIFKANESMFQTGWFIESLATQVLVIFIIRTARQPFFRSLPGIWLTVTTLIVVALGIIIPFMPFSASLGFSRLPSIYFLFLFLLVGTYLLIVEFIKNRFLRSNNQ